MAERAAALDPRTPVLVGVGQVEQRVERPEDSRDPAMLLADAALAAQADSTSERLIAALDTIAVIRIHSWPYADAAAAVAERIGANPRRTLATDDGGNYPQFLLNRAAAEIQAGTADAVLIGGAECWRTANMARRSGTTLPWARQDATLEPTTSFANPAELWHPVEWARHVIMPVTYYALFENACRAAHGWSIDDHRDRIAALWSGLSDVAAENPAAWIRQPATAEAIRNPSPSNRMVSFPYTKHMNANSSVEQAAAFVLCSVERARSLGIPTDRWVFPWTGTEAQEHWFASNRDKLHEAPAIRLAGRAALAHAGLGPDDIDHVDLYSCFPSAVQIAAAELGFDTDRPLTVTGGLSFAGGPWNNYVSHSIAAMAHRLRAEPGTTGLVTANGGWLTKHAFGVYSTTPPPDRFHHENLQSQVDALPRREVVEIPDGQVTIESSTVGHDRNGEPERGVATVLTADGRRSIGAFHDPELFTLFETEETAGRAARIDAEGTLHLV